VGAPTPPLPGQHLTFKDTAAVAEAAATRVAAALRDAILKRGAASLALSGGNTPRPAYERLASEPGVAWGAVSVYWIDERAVPPDHARSNYRLALESLLFRAPIPAASVHRMTGEATDLDHAARDYEALLRSRLSPPVEGGVPSFDVAVLGIGDDGHTASLFPGEGSVDVRDRLVLAIPAAPEHDREARLTVTTPVIESIGTVLVLAVGAAKRGPLERVAAEAGSARDTPSRLFRGARGALTWLTDEAAAGR